VNGAAPELNREPSLATFLRLFVLAAFVYATARTPRSVFALRALAPEGLAAPGELLAACLAGTAAGVLVTDDRGRFVLAPPALSAGRPRALAVRVGWHLRCARDLRTRRAALPREAVAT
jgi:hypothetical protein